MKKKFKLSLLFCLFFPLLAFASVKVSFDDAKWSSNTYITQFSNYRWYIDFNTKKKYAYNGSAFSEVSGFDRGGLVNLNEYKISLEDGKSYLRTVRPYWTMTLNGSKIYSINDGTASLLDRTSIASGARPTEYIIHQTEVTGQGSFRDPWMFVKPEFYVDVEYNSPQIKRNGTGVIDTAVEYDDIVTYSIGLKNNGVKDSVINIREVALISAIDKLVKLKLDTSADVKLTIGDKTMSLSEAKAAANAVLSDNGYTVTIAPGQEMTLEFNVVIIGNAGQVINNQLLYVMDGLEADPGTKNSMYIEKVVQYNEVAENGANVVLALDNSGSMGASRSSTTSKISKLKDANKEFLEEVENRLYNNGYFTLASKKLKTEKGKESNYNKMIDKLFQGVYPQLNYATDNVIRKSYYGGLSYVDFDNVNKFKNRKDKKGKLENLINAVYTAFYFWCRWWGHSHSRHKNSPLDYFYLRFIRHSQ